MSCFIYNRVQCMPSYLTQEFSYGFETSQNYNQENGVHLIAFCLPFVTFFIRLKFFRGDNQHSHTVMMWRMNINWTKQFRFEMCLLGGGNWMKFVEFRTSLKSNGSFFCNWSVFVFTVQWVKTDQVCFVFFCLKKNSFRSWLLQQFHFHRLYFTPNTQ